MPLPQIFPGCRPIIRGQTGYELGITVLLTSLNYMTEPAAKKSASKDLEVILVMPPGVKEHS